MQTKLDEAESQNRRLQMEADQYQRQIRQEYPYRWEDL